MKYYRLRVITDSSVHCSVCGSVSANRVIQVSGTRCVVSEADMLDIIKDSDGGSVYSVEPVEMTEQEFTELPEFNGF